MQLSFLQPASLAEVREYCAEVARLVRPGIQGEWIKVSSTPQPHQAYDGMAELARTAWQLADATLIQSLSADVEGNPRDGYGFQMSIDVTIPGPDGAARRLLLSDSGWDPSPKELLFQLVGFSAAEFTQARAAGARRFSHDETAHPVRAVQNVEDLLRLGARDAARALIDEALARDNPPFARESVGDLLRHRVELTDEPSARAAAEAAALLGNPRDLERLERVARGDLLLPHWTEGAAARVLSMMAPWHPLAPNQLAEVAHRWLAHPWWRPATHSRVAGWCAVRHQPHEYSAGRHAAPSLVGDPKPLAFQYVLGLVQKALGLGDVTISFRLSPPLVGASTDGVILGLDGQLARVRAVAQLRQQDDACEHRWAWLWTGVGLEGAVLVSRFARPVDESLRPPANDTFLLCLGDEATAPRVQQELLAQNEFLRFLPAPA